MRTIEVRVPGGGTGRVQLHRTLTVTALTPDAGDVFDPVPPDGVVTIALGELASHDAHARRDELDRAEAAVRDASAALERAATRLDEAEKARTRTAAAFDDAHRQRQDADATAAAAATQLDAARSARESAQRELDRSTQLLDEANERASAADDVRARLAGWLGRSAERRAPDEASLDELDEIAARLDELGIGRGHEQLRSWTALVRADNAPLASVAQSLLERHSDVQRRAADAVPVDEDKAVQAADERGRAAAALRAELNAILAVGDIDDESRAAIDEAHAAVVDSTRRFGRAPSDGTMEAERALLGRYGFSSYLDYSIAISTGGLRAHAERTLAIVQGDLERAHEALIEARRAAVNRADALRRAQEDLSRDIETCVGRQLDDDALVAELVRWVAVPPSFRLELELVESAATALGTAAAEANDAHEEAKAAATAAREAEDGAASAAAAAEAERDRLVVAEADRERELTSANEQQRLASEDHAAATQQLAETTTAHRAMEADPFAPGERDAHIAVLRERIMGVPEAVEALLVFDDPRRADDRDGAAGGEGRERTIALLTAIAAEPLPARVLFVTDDESILSWAKTLDRRQGWCVQPRIVGGRSKPRWWRSVIRA